MRHRNSQLNNLFENKGAPSQSSFLSERTLFSGLSATIWVPSAYASPSATLLPTTCRFRPLGDAALAGNCAADSLAAYEDCVYLLCNAFSAVWYTDHGGFHVDATNGCRDTGIPGMTEFCVDWGQWRGHFRFDGQPDKRCFRQTATQDVDCGDAAFELHCTFSTWFETPCTW